MRALLRLLCTTLVFSASIAAESNALPRINKVGNLLSWATYQQRKQPEANDARAQFLYDHGAITRGDRKTKKLALVFTGDEFAGGADTIARTLKAHGVKGSFFFTGRFYRNPKFRSAIRRLKRDGHYLGAHSDDHLLYCDWNARDKLLVSREKFREDLNKNYASMRHFGIARKSAPFFLPPYEWYNQTITDWTAELNLQLINYTPGTRSHADYTTPTMKNYVNSEVILQSIKNYEAKDPAGLNGFILLVHVGVAPERADKFYDRLDELLDWLKVKGYQLTRIDSLLRLKALPADQAKHQASRHRND